MLPRLWIYGDSTWVVNVTRKDCLPIIPINSRTFNSLKDVICPVYHTTFPFNSQSIHLS